jgi:hypothetical protein
MRERDEHARELQRAHHTIAMLREENDRLRRAVAAAYAALRPHANKSSGQGDGPVRKSRRCFGQWHAAIRRRASGDRRAAVRGAKRAAMARPRKLHPPQPQPGDELLPWPREKLERMDQAFRQAKSRGRAMLRSIMVAMLMLGVPAACAYAQGNDARWLHGVCVKRAPRKIPLAKSPRI